MVNTSKLMSMDDATLNQIHAAVQAEVMRRRAASMPSPWRPHTAAAGFRHGDLVSFWAKGRRVIVRVHRFNPKTMSGLEVDPATLRELPNGRWRVSPSLCTKYEPPVKPAPAPAVVAEPPRGAFAGTF